MTLSANAEEIVKSPDGKVQVTFDVVAGRPTYSIAYGSQSVIKPSHLGLQLAKGGEDLMDGFTLAQITEFIKAAQEANAGNVTAALLEYKNNTYPDFDPMAEFTLEW